MSEAKTECNEHENRKAGEKTYQKKSGTEAAMAIADGLVDCLHMTSRHEARIVLKSLIERLQKRSHEFE